MTIMENMMLAPLGQPGESLLGLITPGGRNRRSEAALAERAMALLSHFNLQDKAADYAGTLSGGQRKLLDLVRALMAEPRILLLDEPMAGVSPAVRVELLEHILGLREREGLTFLIVEHDLDFVMRASDRVVVMSEGRVIAEGTPDEVRADERVVDAYLGTRH
jgi:neutral amino acid transport system ATP-binding protein